METMRLLNVNMSGDKKYWHIDYGVGDTVGRKYREEMLLGDSFRELHNRVEGAFWVQDSWFNGRYQVIARYEV